MARNFSLFSDTREVWRHWNNWIVGVLVLGMVVGLILHLLSRPATTVRRVEAPPMLMIPPAPPPPPVPEKQPEPEKPKPELAEPEPKPLDMPKLLDNLPDITQVTAEPITIDGPAQAGTDAFGVQAGRGGGMTAGVPGGGTGVGGYERYVAFILQQALARDPRTRRLAFENLRVDLWLDPTGKPTRVELVQSAGNAEIDKAVLAMLRDLDGMEQAPPPSFRYPMRVSIRGRRPG